MIGVRLSWRPATTFDDGRRGDEGFRAHVLGDEVGVLAERHAGYLVKSGLDFGYAFNLQGDDRLGWIADMGWMLGPLMIVGALQFGAGIVF